jgi:nicotinate-nucleotide adenylyltransferase
MMAKKLIGLYGGTFDPFHLGHLNLALEIREKKGLDEVWFCLAKINPHKLNGKTPVSAEHRLKILQLALEGIPGYKILDIEIKREGPSYTIDTLRYLLDKEDTKNSFALIIGQDSVQDFFHWRDAEEIVRLVPLYVGSRKCNIAPGELKGSPVICQALIEGWTPTRVMEISATEVRQRLNQGLYCGHLIPKESLDYIYKNQLYYTR